VLGDRLSDPDDVGLLKSVATHHGASNLSGNRHHRRAVHVRGREAGDQIGGAGAGGGDADPCSPGGAGIAIGRVRRRLLVPDENVTQTGKLRQRVIERHDRAAGVAEEELDSLFKQRAAEDLRAG
jgi:hypothetical protein